MKCNIVLSELARQVRGDTLQVLEAAQDNWLHWAPAGTSNTILWHAGHALWLQDLMCIAPLSGRSELPSGWAARFGAKSQPANIDDWPTRKELHSLLQAQLQQMLIHLDAATDEVLNQMPQQLKGDRNMFGWIIHGLHDEAKHNGEMYLLWKICRARSRATNVRTRED